MTSSLGIGLAINGQALQSELPSACKGHAICAQQNQRLYIVSQFLSLRHRYITC